MSRNTPTRAIVASWSMPFNLILADMLARDHEWEFVYWIAGVTFEPEVRKRFPSIVYHVSNDARRGIYPTETQGFKRPPLDAEILETYLPTEREVMTQCNRLNAVDGSFGYQDRLNLFYDQLSYWLGVVEETQPTVAIFMTTPHLIYDQILYDICKQQGIRVVIFEKTNIVGWIYAHDDFKLGNEAMIAEYRRRLAAGDRVEISDLCDRMVSALAAGSGDYQSAMPVSLRQAMLNSGVNPASSAKRTPGRLSRYVSAGLRILGRVGSAFVQFGLNRIPEAATKIDGKPLAVMKMTRLEYLKDRSRIRRAKNVLQKTYQELSQVVDLTCPFIYVTLQLQPEQSTNPQGGAFQNQDLMVRLLADQLPAGWRLYVKEHVASLLDHSQFERARRPSDYIELLQLPGVTLVRPEMNSFDLIDNCRAVATISGSTGWEAVLRRKPALLFGYAWYRGCEGVFSVPTARMLEASLKSILDGYEVDHGKLRLYLKVLEDYGFEGFNIPSWGKASNIPDDVNAQAFVRELAAITAEPPVETESHSVELG